MDKILEAITIWQNDMATGYLDYLKNPNILTPVTLMTVELHGIAGDVNDIRENMKGIINGGAIASAEPKKDEAIDLISLAKDGMGWIAALVGFNKNWQEIEKLLNGFLKKVFNSSVGQASGNPESFKQMVEGFTLLPSVKEGISSGTLPGWISAVKAALSGFGGSIMGALSAAFAAIIPYLMPLLGLGAILFLGKKLVDAVMKWATGKNFDFSFWGMKKNVTEAITPKVSNSIKESLPTASRKIESISSLAMEKMNATSRELGTDTSFTDRSAMLEVQQPWSSLQPQGDTVYQITMNNSFAVDREETADYCISELYRRMRAELDGARLGVAY